jgi:outer membrane receptor protein involved in Fe transport
MNLFNRIGVISNSRTRKNTTGKFIYTDWAKNDAYVPAPWDWANDYDGIDRAGTDILGGVLDRITNENVINNEFQVQMSKDFKEFSNKFILGYSVYQRKTKQTEVSSGSIVQEGVFNVANRQGELGGGESNSTERKYGYYADLTTGWRDILYLHGSFRYDATSRFYKNDRDASLYSYPYYGVDASFVLTDAFPKMQSDIFNYAKIRAGFNKNGNDNINLYGLDLTFPNGAGFPYGSTVGFTVGDVLPDANLKPEFVYSYEVGGEFQFWKNRISLELTAYTQNSKGQVLTVKVPNTTGFPNLLINVGETKNWGYETDLRVQVIKKPKFNWEISARYSYNNNKVEKLFNGVDEFAYGGYSYAQTYVIKGQSYPAMKATAYVRDPVTRSRCS